MLVTVNGQELRESSGEYRVWKDYLSSQVGDDVEMYASLIQQYAMDYAIRYTAMTQKLEEMGKGVTEEELAASAAEVRDSWNSIVEQYMANLYGVSAEATDEEKAAAKADTLAYILENYGYTEESYVEEAMMYNRLNMIYSRAEAIASEGIEVADQEVEDYFKTLVEEDKAFFNEMIQPAEGEEKTEEQMKEELVQAYEFYTQYYGYETQYRPEGYRGITHILLGVDQELLDKWLELTAKLEEQNEETELIDAEAVTEAEAETVTEAKPEEQSEETKPTDAAAETDTEAKAETTAEPEEPEEPVTEEMVAAAKQAILDSVKEKLEEIEKKLADGASFEDLILEYGTDPGMENDATRAEGYAVHPYSIMFDQNFTKGAAALEKVGDVSDPIVSQFGVHILHYLRDIPGGAVELTDTLKEELRGDLMSEKVGAAFNDLQEKWVAESEVVWTEAGASWKIDEAALAADETDEETAEAAEEVPAE